MRHYKQRGGHLELAESELERIKGAAGGKRTFKKLASNYWTTLLEFGSRERYRPGTPIVSEADRDVGVSFVARAKVQIERSVSDRTVEIGHLADGSVFGQMSFLNKAGAGTSFVADGSVDVIHIKN